MLLAGSTPSTLTLAAMPQPEQLAVREAMEMKFGWHSGWPIRIPAQALVVSGLA